MKNTYLSALGISFAIVFPVWLMLATGFDGCGEGGWAGEYCRRDGTCASPKLECVNSGIVAQVPIDRPYCRVKK